MALGDFLSRIFGPQLPGPQDPFDPFNTDEFGDAPTTSLLGPQTFAQPISGSAGDFAGPVATGLPFAPQSAAGFQAPGGSPSISPQSVSAGIPAPHVPAVLPGFQAPGVIGAVQPSAAPTGGLTLSQILARQAPITTGRKEFFNPGIRQARLSQFNKRQELAIAQLNRRTLTENQRQTLGLRGQEFGLEQKRDIAAAKISARDFRVAQAKDKRDFAATQKQQRIDNKLDQDQLARDPFAISKLTSKTAADKSARDFTAAQNKDKRDFAATQKQQRIDNELAKKQLARKPFAQDLTPFEKQADISFAKETSTYEAGGGSAGAQKSIRQLIGVRKKLEARIASTGLDPSKDLSGNAVGLVPDFLLPINFPDAAAMQDLVGEISQVNLRRTLGAQVTADEVKDFTKKAFNPALSEEENLTRINRRIKLMQTIDDRQTAKSNWVLRKGSLRGFTGIGSNSNDLRRESSPEISEEIKVGTTATNAQGVVITWNGQQWVAQ